MGEHLHEEAAHDQQHERHRHLPDDERPAKQPALASVMNAAAGLEQGPDVGAAGVQCGCEPRENAGE